MGFLENIYDNAVVIDLTGNLFFGNIEKLEKQWEKAISNGLKIIAFNCGKLTAIDSTAIGYFVKFNNNAINEKKKFILYDINPKVKNVIKTARLDELFLIISKTEFEEDFL